MVQLPQIALRLDATIAHRDRDFELIAEVSGLATVDLLDEQSGPLRP